jgi:hypothetical protein
MLTALIPRQRRAAARNGRDGAPGRPYYSARPVVAPYPRFSITRWILGNLLRLGPGTALLALPLAGAVNDPTARFCSA